MIDLTPIIVASIILIGSVIVTFAIPRIKANMPDKQWDTLMIYAKAAVQAAEVIYKSGHGEAKLEFAMKQIKEQCERNHLEINPDTIWVAVEKALDDLKEEMIR